jgi:hypothetical protein
MKRAVMIAFCTVIAASATAVEPTQNLRRRAVRPAVQIQGWSIEITTQGGFTGSGNGGVTVSSDGKIGILLLGDSAPRCTFQLDAAALASVTRVVTLASPQTWVESYVPAPLQRRCCDMITTSLRLTRNEDGRDVVYETRWLGGASSLPFDLADLISTVINGESSVRSRYIPLCTKTP